MGAETLAGWGILALAGISWAGLLLKPGIRRECRTHPWLGLFGIALVGSMTALVIWVSARTPMGRRVMAAGVAAAAGLAWLGARPGFGKRKGLPPGSLGLGTSLDALDRADFYEAAARRWGPVFKMRQFHRPVVCVTDLPMAGAFLRDQRESLRQVRWPFNRLVPGGYVEFMDGDQHARYRALFQPGFGPDVVAACRPHWTAAVRNELEAMVRAEAPQGLAPMPHLERIALAALLRMVVGVDLTDPRASGIPDLLTALDRPIHVLLPVPAASREAFARLAELVRAVGTESATATRSPLPSSVLAEILRSEPGLVHDEVVIGNLVTMLKDGRNMLRMLLVWTMQISADDDRWAAQIRSGAASNPAAGDDLARQYVLEVLRTRLTPYIYRRVVRDCRLGGYLIPRGWLVRICLEQAHHRAEVFQNPSDFNPARFATRSYGPDEFMPFSTGEHACFADRFVMEFAIIFMRELAIGYDLQLVRSGPGERENRHWAYRLPSRHLRLRLTAVQDRDRSVQPTARSMVIA